MTYQSQKLPIKLLALDVDGTTVDDHKQLSSKNSQAIKHAQQAGVEVCVVTGRKELDLQMFFEQFKHRGYYSCNNGAKVVDRATGEVIANRMVALETVGVLLDYALKEHISLNIVSGKQWFATYVTEQVESYTKPLGICFSPLQAVEQLRGLDIDGVFVNHNGKKIAAFAQSQGLALSAEQTGEDDMDFMPHGIGKGTAVGVLQQRLGIQKEQIISVGNYYNDIDMFYHAGIGIAVQNAPAAVKQCADYVTQSTNNEDAIVEIVERFILRR